MQLPGFATVPFPRDEDIVYALSFSKENNSPRFFYVGESRRGTRRISDYITAQFAASTDFKVGKAVAALQKRGFSVHVHYKASDDRKSEESKLIMDLRLAGHKLLNDYRGYDYKSALKEQELERLESFVSSLLESNSPEAD